MNPKIKTPNGRMKLVVSFLNNETYIPVFTPDQLWVILDKIVSEKKSTLSDIGLGEITLGDYKLYCSLCTTRETVKNVRYLNVKVDKVIVQHIPTGNVVHGVRTRCQSLDGDNGIRQVYESCCEELKRIKEQNNEHRATVPPDGGIDQM